jgi:sulfur-carrier protein
MVSVRYFAGARAGAGGISTEQVEATALDELLQTLIDHHGERLAVVLKVSSFLIDGLACHDRHAALQAGTTVDILPPFAGG